MADIIDFNSRRTRLHQHERAKHHLLAILETGELTWESMIATRMQSGEFTVGDLEHMIEMSTVTEIERAPDEAIGHRVYVACGLSLEGFPAKLRVSVARKRAIITEVEWLR